jgi:hypothetical protein
MAHYQLKYGTQDTGTPYRDPTEGGTWFRRDTYRSHLGGEFLERYFADGPTDDSAPHLGSYGGSYDPGCACCWLGFGHTERRHATAVRQARGGA